MPKRLGMTQIELAEVLGTDSGSISRFETGRREPSLLEILAYSRLSRIGVELLIDDKLSFSKNGNKCGLGRKPAAIFKVPVSLVLLPLSNEDLKFRYIATDLQHGFVVCEPNK